jgi:hypothetical protein
VSEGEGEEAVADGEADVVPPEEQAAAIRANRITEPFTRPDTDRTLLMKRPISSGRSP